MTEYYVAIIIGDTEEAQWLCFTVEKTMYV